MHNVPSLLLIIRNHSRTMVVIETDVLYIFDATCSTNDTPTSQKWHRGDIVDDITRQIIRPLAVSLDPGISVNLVNQRSFAFDRRWSGDVAIRYKCIQ